MGILLWALIICTLLYVAIKINKGRPKVEPKIVSSPEATEEPKEEVVEEEPKAEEVEEETVEESDETSDPFSKLNKVSSEILKILDEFEEKAKKYGDDITISMPKEKLPEELRPLKEKYEKLKKEENELFKELLSKK